MGGGAGKNFATAKPVKEEESNLLKKPSEDENDLEGVTTFTDYPDKTVKWFNNPKLSNMADWEKGLTDDEKGALSYYTGSGYMSLNPELYNTPWDEMTPSMKKKATNLFNALNKFELNKAIKTVRQCDFQIFGAPSYKKMTAQQVKDYLNNEANGGYIQVNGFLSSTTKPNGTFSDSKGVWIDLTTPPNKGGGAYVSHIGNNSGEAEYLYNNNAVLKFDPNSVHEGKDGYIHVSAEWVGQAKDQHFKNKNK